MTHIPNNIGKGGFDELDDGIDVPEDTYKRMCDWIDSIEFDENDILDMSRTNHFDEYRICVENFNGAADDVSVQDSENIGFMLVDNFMEIGE